MKINACTFLTGLAALFLAASTAFAGNSISEMMKSYQGAQLQTGEITGPVLWLRYQSILADEELLSELADIRLNFPCGTKPELKLVQVDQRYVEAFYECDGLISDKIISDKISASNGLQMPLKGNSASIVIENYKRILTNPYIMSYLSNVRAQFSCSKTPELTITYVGDQYSKLTYDCDEIESLPAYIIGLKSEFK